MKRQNRQDEQVNPVRLFDAADAVITAIREYERVSGGPCPYPPELLVSPDQPVALREFTRHEIEEATSVLVRMGFIVVPRTPH